MQVAKTGRTRPASTASPAFERHVDRSASYAPLYLSSSLGSLSFDIEDLQDLASRRLRLLKSAIPPTASAPSTPAIPVDVLNDAVRRAEREHGFHIPPVGNAEREDAILRDEAAHFLVRLALCVSHETRQWFLTRECALFAMRIASAGADYALQRIHTSDGPDIRPVPEQKLNEGGLREELDAVARGVRKAQHGEEIKYYMVDFEHVASLVRARRVLVKSGVAYVPDRNVRDVVVAQFRAKLNHALITSAKAVGLAEQDARMRSILTDIRESLVAEENRRMKFDGDRDANSISLDELKDALPAMPLCQLNLMQRLSGDHHLRHAGRMQLGVFLKGCGLTMDESLRYWKSEFLKGGMAADKWEKNYAYNIRHHYGKEGKRKNLAPFNCLRVINDRPGPGEHHGCPYREFNEARLRNTLQTAGAEAGAVKDILGQARDGNFQGACGLCFAATQPGQHESSESGTPLFFPNHPNEYFIEARQRRIAHVRTGASAGEDAEMADEADMPPVHSAVETQGAETQGAETQGAETQAADAKGGKAQIDETQGAEAQGVETPGAEAPGAEAPGAEAPGAEAPGAEAPVAEAPGAEAPGAEGLAGKSREDGDADCEDESPAAKRARVEVPGTVARETLPATSGTPEAAARSE